MLRIRANCIACQQLESASDPVHRGAAITSSIEILHPAGVQGADTRLTASIEGRPSVEDVSSRRLPLRPRKPGCFPATDATPMPVAIQRSFKTVGYVAAALIACRCHRLGGAQAAGP
jgi:hypothetical protein